ncbi:MAG: SDR family oxidoreductase [Vicinamibacterales bacterium]
MSKGEWTGRRVWVTGASSGIGEALVMALVRDGGRVVISARRLDKLHAVRAATDRPDHVAIVSLDQGQPERVGEAVQSAVHAFGGLDTVVLNGGVSQRSLARDTSLDVDRALMTVNYLANVAITKAVLPALLEQPRPQIVVISSVVGRVGSPYRSGYAASKHALHGFFDSLRAELPPHVTVTIVCPGFVKTDISMHSLTADGSPLNQMDRAQARGMAADVFAARALRAVLKRRREVVIGGTERWAVWLQRLVPGILARVVRHVRVR